MLRDMSAIGLSRYTGQQAARDLITSMMASEKIRGQSYQKDDGPWVELVYPMGPFALTLRGKDIDHHRLNIRAVIPTLKEKRGYVLKDFRLQQDDSDQLFLSGLDTASMEEICLEVTEERPFIQSPDSFYSDTLVASCYGMSHEAKILLPTYRTLEDQKAMREEEIWHRNVLERASRGDREAEKAIESEEKDMDEEVRERLKTEDVYSIFDGFMYPAMEGINCYTVLGDITGIEKLFNPLSNEWVYYLDLSVMGQNLRVLVNPSDLTGQPRKGRRFQGIVHFYGRTDPARVLLEDIQSFY